MLSAVDCATADAFLTIMPGLQTYAAAQAVDGRASIATTIPMTAVAAKHVLLRSRDTTNLPFSDLSSTRSALAPVAAASQYRSTGRPEEACCRHDRDDAAFRGGRQREMPKLVDKRRPATRGGPLEK